MAGRRDPDCIKYDKKLAGTLSVIGDPGYHGCGPTVEQLTEHYNGLGLKQPERDSELIYSESADKVKGDAKYLALLDELRELHLKKSEDYGSSDDPLTNLRQSIKLGIPPWVGCILRLTDKLQRVHSLIANGKLANESIDDNLMDMGAYALLALRLLREGKDG